MKKVLARRRSRRGSRRQLPVGRRNSQRGVRGSYQDAMHDDRLLERRAATPRWSRRGFQDLQLSRRGLLGVSGPALHLRQHRLQHRLVPTRASWSPSQKITSADAQATHRRCVGSCRRRGGGLPRAERQRQRFDVCPSGNAGVVGGHTSCAFADNVQRAGMASLGNHRRHTARSPPIYRCMHRYGHKLCWPVAKRAWA